MLAYDLFVSNQSCINGDDNDSDGSLDFNGYADSHYGKVHGRRRAWQFAGALGGLEVGANGYTDTIDAFAGGNPNHNSNDSYNRNQPTVGGADAAGTSDELELVSEWCHIATETKFINAGPGTLGSHSSGLWFVRGAYTFGDFVPMPGSNRRRWMRRIRCFPTLSTGVPASAPRPACATTSIRGPR